MMKRLLYDTVIYSYLETYLQQSVYESTKQLGDKQFIRKDQAIIISEQKFIKEALKR